MYKLEKLLVDEFINYVLKTPFQKWGVLEISTEFNYIRGRADIIGLAKSGEILAFEAKLINWREALHQAYRNTCFAHYSFILIPENVAYQATKYLSDFRERSVGICYFSNQELHIPLAPPKNTPLQNWLSIKAINTIEGDLDYHASKQSNQSCDRIMPNQKLALC